jgi:hypothetical protein
MPVWDTFEVTGPHEFSDLRGRAAVRPSAVRSWTAKLKADGLADSYVTRSTLGCLR